jgi:hypothetical protein
MNSWDNSFQQPSRKKIGKARIWIGRWSADWNDNRVGADDPDTSKDCKYPAWLGDPRGQHYNTEKKNEQSHIRKRIIRLNLVLSLPEYHHFQGQTKMETPVEG